jgi:hypothetical protein
MVDMANDLVQFTHATATTSGPALPCGDFRPVAAGASARERRTILRANVAVLLDACCASFERARVALDAVRRKGPCWVDAARFADWYAARDEVSEQVTWGFGVQLFDQEALVDDLVPDGACPETRVLVRGLVSDLTGRDDDVGSRFGCSLQEALTVAPEAVRDQWSAIRLELDDALPLREVEDLRAARQYVLRHLTDELRELLVRYAAIRGRVVRPDEAAAWYEVLDRADGLLRDHAQQVTRSTASAALTWDL